MSALGRPKHLGWSALAMVATLMALGGVLDVVWRVMHGDLIALVLLPLGLLFWYWIGVGAWRRAEQRS